MITIVSIKAGSAFAGALGLLLLFGPCLSIHAQRADETAPDQPAEKEPLRFFRNSDGKELKARIVAGNSTTVSLQLENGRNTNAPLSAFSPEDQKFIIDWLEEHPEAVPHRFRFTQSAKRLSKEKVPVVGSTPGSRSSEMVGQGAIEEWVYDIKMQNHSFVDLKDLEVECRIFYGDSDGVLVHTSEQPISSMKHLEEVQFQTDPVDLSQGKLDPDFVAVDGRNRIAHSLKGIWIVVYRNGHLVADYRSTPSLVQWYYQGAGAFGSTVDLDQVPPDIRDQVKRILEAEEKRSQQDSDAQDRIIRRLERKLN